MNNISKRIALGYPLDLLLNRDCKFNAYEKSITAKFKDIKKDNNVTGSVILPQKDNPGTGNIIIRGKPGTAKSTLAMQFAVSAAQKNNNCISFYITLEERPENIFYKTKTFGWDSYCSIFNQLCGLDQSASASEYRDYLEKAMEQDTQECRFHDNVKGNINCKEHHKKEIKPHVFISTLTPRNLFVSETKELNLFWDRYEQLERLLAASEAYNNEKWNSSKPKISFVVIDSINVFGDGLLSRTELFRLFDLFKKYQIIGIIIVEEDEKYIFQNDNKLHGETLEYISDVIISLTSEEDQCYSMRYFEITKSRYQHQVYGKHPFKIVESIITPEMQKEFFEVKIENKELSVQNYKNTWMIEGFKEFKDLPKEFSIESKNIFFQPIGLINKQEFKLQLKKGIENKILVGDNEKKNYSVCFEKSDSHCKIIEVKEKQNTGNDGENNLIIMLPLFSVYAVKVFPSLHYIVYGTDISDSGKPSQNMEHYRDVFCDHYANIYLSKDHKKNNSLMIEGPRDTFKTSLARDFLMNGLFEDANANAHVLFIRFLDYNPGDEKLKSFRISESCRDVVFPVQKEKEGENKFKAFICKNGEPEPFWNENQQHHWAGLQSSVSLQSTKRFLSTYCCKVEEKYYKKFTELIYQSGYIFPEEFIQIFLETIQEFNPNEVKRIAIDEIGRIGSSYPLLYQSKIAGDLFLTALIHIIRNYNIKLLITGTTGEYSRSDEIIDKTKTLVDDLLTTKKINVFGDNYVTIQGGTLTSSENRTDAGEYSNENIPGVILPTGKYLFKVDNSKFVGLVGFDTDKIYRPGIDLYLFNESNLHKNYNKELVELLKYAFSYWEKVLFLNNDLNIEIHSFNGSKTTSFHDSLKILQGKPIRKTLICTIDEFYSKNTEDIKNIMVPINKEIIDKEFNSLDLTKDYDGNVYSLPYYDNLLFIVYNTDSKISESIDDYKTWVFDSWDVLYKKIAELEKENPGKVAFDFISNTDETLSCLLLDALYSAIYKSENIELIEKFNDLNKNSKIKLDILIDDLIDFTEGKDMFYSNLNSLSKIIKMSVKSSIWTGKDTKGNVIDKEDRNKIKSDELIPNSIFLICWYSQLRELINSHPHLTSKLYAYSLPGGGFTGDWQIAIMKGSVSITLGYEVLTFLCSEEEDYKRFVRGIGLPTKLRFYKQNNQERNTKARFMAWPNSKVDFYPENESTKKLVEELGVTYEEIPPIFKLYDIHDNAHKRSNILKYTTIRQSLIILFKQLICLENENEIKSNIIERMSGILKRFNGNNKNSI